MIRRPPRSTRTDTLFPYTTLFRSTWRTINGRVVTFAERWKEQREAFLNGEQQHAIGTPLEELKAYGATPAMISLCRASNIQTIERSEERRVGKEGVSTCRYRWSPYQ